MSSTTSLTLEQFEQLPEDGVQYELRDGELVRMGTAKTGHERICPVRTCGGLRGKASESRV